MAAEISAEAKASIGLLLDEAFWQLSNRGLFRAARWAADALAGLASDYERANPPRLDRRTMQAKSYFDCKEYERAWNCIDPKKTDATGAFLRPYARYLAGERIKEDALGSDIFSDTSTQAELHSKPLNPFIDEILTEVDTVGRDDPHLAYLRGMMLRAKHRPAEALEALKESVIAYPFNWSSWLELKACLTRVVSVEQVLADLTSAFRDSSPAAKVMLTMFHSFASEETDPVGSAELLTTKLIPSFPDLHALQTQLARIYNGEGHYAVSAQIFERILEEDPFRLEDLDSYSNLLYVTEQRAKLAYLAQHAATTNKYRAETCCIVANYYSLKGEHARAVMQYKRAIVLNRNYMPAWTLMGHEFIELGNPHAAIETYRTAVDLYSGDFRPWFGLGQAYEVLGMHYFALFYFQRALALRPTDVRLWDALGNSYEQLKLDHDAINAFEQAFAIAEGDVYYGYRLGVLYDRAGDTDAAIKYITACANSGGVDANPLDSASELDKDDDYSEWPSHARLWLAKRAMDASDWGSALQWARKVTHGTREMLEEARSIERSARIAAEEAAEAMS